MTPPRSSSSTDRTKIATTLVLAACFATRAPADIVVADWYSFTNFAYQVRYMPDLDQRRTGLPDNGSRFALPTATMNMFAYASEWGVDDMLPGPGVYGNPDGHYDSITGHLNDLGGLMHSSNGTSTEEWKEGAEEWIDSQPLVVSTYVKGAIWCPTVSEVARHGSTGALVTVGYGRYECTPAAMPLIHSKLAGYHATVIYADANGANDLKFWVRDAADDYNFSSQSQWAYRIFDPVDTMTVFQDWNDDGAYGSMTVTALEYTPPGGGYVGDTEIFILDKIYTLRPGGAFTWDTIELAFLGDIAPDLSWYPSPPGSFNPPNDYVIEDVVVAPNFQQFFILVDGPNGKEIMFADRAAGNVEPFESGLDQVLSVAANRMAMGRHGELYVLDGIQIVRGDVADPGQPEAIGQLAAPGQAMVYCDLADEVIVVSTLSRKLTVFNRSLDSQLEYDLPLAIPPSANPSIALRDCDGAMALWRPESPHLVHGIRPTAPGGPLEHSVLTLPEPGTGSVSFDDQGHLLVSGQSGSVLDFVADPDPECWWCWTPAENSWYSDLENRGQFRVFRSRSSYDPAINAEDDIDTPADEPAGIGTVVNDCPGDFDNDGVAGFADLSQLLVKWGPCPGCPEDLDGDISVGFVDLVLLLNHWGECLPVSP